MLEASVDAEAYIAFGIFFLHLFFGALNLSRDEIELRGKSFLFDPLGLGVYQL